MAGGAKVQSPAKAPTVVGPNVRGKREEYQLVRHLQSALFGGVYEGKGLSSGREFAIKVLHKSELVKAEENRSIEFCEVPLSEIHFAELLKGDDHVMEAEEHFEDLYCYYVVFDLCRGGDLLEALKQKPHGFEEGQAQFLIKQAAQGLAYLHGRCVAMQDVSLENMLLHVNDKTGEYQVKVCDPGQAVIFQTDQNGEELHVDFKGLVGKSFRPPELHDQKPYQATKVDSWCLGWSTFYLLTAQPLFMSADPQQQDADWLLFQQGEYTRLFLQKNNLCSRLGLDFIFRLLQLEPSRRMSVSDALEHAWLADPKIAPVLAPKELLPESLRKGTLQEKEAELPAKEPERVNGGRSPVNTPAPAPPMATGGLGGMTSTGSGTPGLTWLGSTSSGLPTWAAASITSSKQQVSPALRDRGRHGQPAHNGVRRNYVIATNHSPPPGMGMQARPSYMSPRAMSRPKLSGVATSSPLSPRVKSPDVQPNPAWTFGSAASLPEAQSPGRKQGTVYVTTRSPSPSPQHAHAPGSATVPARVSVRSPNPVGSSHTHSSAPGGFLWNQAPTSLSPVRGGPSWVAQPLSPVNTVRSVVGFAWSPDPPSPRALSPRATAISNNPSAFTFAKAFTGSVSNIPQFRPAGIH